MHGDGRSPHGRLALRRFASTLALAMIAATLASGCVRRTLTITTIPDGGLVFLNDEEVGFSPVSVDFTWYGDYDVVVRKPGYRTLTTHTRVRQPWYQIPPIDFFAEVLWPGHIHDQREAEFDLQPEVLPTVEELIDRAQAMRQDAASADG